MKIKYYGSSSLTRVSKDIKEVTPELKELAKEMLILMNENEGVGLAAPQVGVNKRLIVVDCGMPWQKAPYVMINPRIIDSKHLVLCPEGCLSFPGIEGNVERYNYIEVEYLNLDWKIVRLKAMGLLSQCIQHEIEHLDGLAFIDKAKDLKDEDIINCKQKIREILNEEVL